MFETEMQGNVQAISLQRLKFTLKVKNKTTEKSKSFKFIYKMSMTLKYLN